MPRKTTSGRSTKDDLREAAIRLGVREGIEGASIRTIAREVGITEGAVYKHYANKDELIREAYTSVVEGMARDKSVLVKTDLPFELAVRAWVKLTYEYFDANPEAFSYVLLMPHRMAERLGEIYTKQGRMFRAFLVRSMEEKQIREMDPELGVALFTGLVLNIPRLINDGSIQGPAVNYAGEISDAVMRVFATGDSTDR
ncbi:MAG: TetR/AcrR family transcriptional regulator [Phycisphaerales bacterium]|nr:TetR/AcrR family transcriptional regulator [Phycisphaerales bacterium]